MERLVNNRYRLKKPLGSGGMAEVFLAHDEDLGRDVAYKRIKQKYAKDEEFVERFRREARSAAALSHPNIVTIHDRGRTRNGSYYLIMEYLPGGSLRDLIEKEGPLPASRAVRFTLQVAEALQEAHGRGIIHRDIKPDNVLLTKKGEVKVGDFGIARAASSETMTEPGQPVGTYAYASPEQKRGKRVDAKTDLYSLGVVLHEMLTGERPSREAELEVPEQLRGIIVRLLSEDPEGRPSAQELIEDLERVSVGIGAGPQTTEVPNLIGQKLPQARSTLANAKLELGKCYQASSVTIAKGRIIEQNPTAGTNAKRGSAVRVWSRRATPEGEIVGQEPAAGTKVKRGSPVDIAVGSGQEPWYTLVLFLSFLTVVPYSTGVEVVFAVLQLLGIVELSIPWWLWLLAPGMFVVGTVVWEAQERDQSGITWSSFFKFLPFIFLGIVFAWAWSIWWGENYGEIVVELSTLWWLGLPPLLLMTGMIVVWWIIE